jgi:thioredoxin 1
MVGKTIFNTSYEEFQRSVIQASFKHPVLLDIWAQWCAPCLVLAPVLEMVINDHAGRITLAKVDVDEGENMKVAGQYKVRGFPTVILFSDGEEKARFHGAKTKSQVESFIDDFI